MGMSILFTLAKRGSVSVCTLKGAIHNSCCDLNCCAVAFAFIEKNEPILV